MTENIIITIQDALYNNLKNKYISLNIKICDI